MVNVVGTTLDEKGNIIQIYGCDVCHFRSREKNCINPDCIEFELQKLRNKFPKSTTELLRLTKLADWKDFLRPEHRARILNIKPDYFKERGITEEGSWK